MRYLIVIAHPDDEALGAGASIRKWSNKGDIVDVCIMCTKVQARACRPADEELNDDLDTCTKYLGVNKKYEGSFPNIEMNTVPHLHLVKFIEKAILESQPDIIITHHPSDTNDDHHQTSIACQVAIRLFQRRPEVKPVKELWYMEVLSATDWSLNSTAKFEPNTFVEVGKEGIEAKIKAMHMYRGVMRLYPHPRSEEGIFANAIIRGGQAGELYAEAFQCVFRRIID
jgi:LmbE family N-acetylglucosaminyl deacetylase